MQVVVCKPENSRAQAPTLIANHNDQGRLEVCFKEGFSTLRRSGPDAISAAFQLAGFDPLQKGN